jgi:hypothetical protein
MIVDLVCIVLAKILKISLSEANGWVSIPSSTGIEAQKAFRSGLKSLIKRREPFQSVS